LSHKGARQWGSLPKKNFALALCYGIWPHAVGAQTIYEEKNGLVAVEAEHFSQQKKDAVRAWYHTSMTEDPTVEPDPDPNHASSASGMAYLEILPDTRITSNDPLQPGINYTNNGGEMAVLEYQVFFNTPGKYYVWVRAFSLGTDDNGLHVGIDGGWPASGLRIQWCEGKNKWKWESKQRTTAVHCGEPYFIFLNVATSGVHTITFSMREDGFEFDKWLMTTDKDLVPQGFGPAEQERNGVPILSLSESELTFSGSAGGTNPASQTLMVTASGNLLLDGLVITEEASWLTIFKSGNGSVRTLTNVVNVTGLLPGVHEASVKILAEGVSKSYRVSLVLGVTSTRAGTSLQKAQAGASDPVRFVRSPWSQTGRANSFFVAVPNKGTAQFFLFDVYGKKIRLPK